MYTYVSVCGYQRVIVYLLLLFILFQIKQTAANVTIVRAQVLKSYDDKLEELKICKNII